MRHVSDDIAPRTVETMVIRWRWLRSLINFAWQTVFFLWHTGMHREIVVRRYRRSTRRNVGFTVGHSGFPRGSGCNGSSVAFEYVLMKDANPDFGRKISAKSLQQLQSSANHCACTGPDSQISSQLSNDNDIRYDIWLPYVIDVNVSSTVNGQKERFGTHIPRNRFLDPFEVLAVSSLLASGSGELTCRPFRDLLVGFPCQEPIQEIRLFRRRSHAIGVSIYEHTQLSGYRSIANLNANRLSARARIYPLEM